MRQSQVLTHLLTLHTQRLWGRGYHELTALYQDYEHLQGRGVSAENIMQALSSYAIDAGQRAILFTDTLRQRGNAYLAHAASGCPTVLAYDYEVVVDGRQLARPVNYALVRVHAPAGVTTRENGRPYIIIDPRAGHGSGIGGFKSDSEVGVALEDGHPVYFVIFRPEPEPHQTIGDVCSAEAEFVREVIARHPEAPNPVIIGNCQGGWAAMLLAATAPEIVGPVVVNGSPLSYWAGTLGKNPLRYLGGLAGGAWPAMLASDLSNGKFDGANLVLNFESLNPGATWWRKYYDLFDKADSEGPRFLDFERWWSGFYFMNVGEIHWILENLFVGNKLIRGRARFDDGHLLDLRTIRSPIIVFASEGDNITPPQQALNWIADLYSDVEQIKLNGQRILYTLHSAVGHLGIFVSAKVAQKEHREIGSTLKSIEALAPGLYELVIHEKPLNGGSPSYSVSFEERTIDDVLRLHDDGRDDEQPFQAVARLSELATDTYEVTLRPWVRAVANPALAYMLVEQHPLRQQRRICSDQNPWLGYVLPALAESTRSHRRPVNQDNGFAQLERSNAYRIERTFDFWRDWRDAWFEVAFYAIYCSPFMHGIGAHAHRQRSMGRHEEFSKRADIVRLLSCIDQGGYAEAVIRMLLLLAQARGSVRRSRLERSNAVLHSREPFSALAAEVRARIIQEQATIVYLEPERALTGLVALLPTKLERIRALTQVDEIAGPHEEMNAATRAMLQELQLVLDVQRPDQAVAPAREVEASVPA